MQLGGSNFSLSLQPHFIRLIMELNICHAEVFKLCSIRLTTVHNIIITYKTQGIRPQQLLNTDRVSPSHCTSTKSLIIFGEINTLIWFRCLKKNSLNGVARHRGSTLIRTSKGTSHKWVYSCLWWLCAASFGL